jgi:antitoxin component YwqK of YwqJK toxin-antitoxin module
MGIFNWLLGKKNLIQENGICKIYYGRDLGKKFYLSNGLLDGKYETYRTNGKVDMTINFKLGKLHGEHSRFFSVKNCFDYIENYSDGILISRQQIRRTDGFDPKSIFGTKYELGPVETDESMLKKSLTTLFTKEDEISSLRKEVTFKLLSENSGFIQ